MESRIECGRCGKVLSTAPMVCAGCRSVAYCNGICEASAWWDPFQPHSNVCAHLAQVGTKVVVVTERGNEQDEDLQPTPPVLDILFEEFSNPESAISLRYNEVYPESVAITTSRMREVFSTITRGLIIDLEAAVGEVSGTGKSAKKGGLVSTLEKKLDKQFPKSSDEPQARELRRRLAAWTTLKTLTDKQSKYNSRVKGARTGKKAKEEAGGKLYEALEEMTKMVGLSQVKQRVYERIMTWLADPGELGDGYLNIMLLGNPGTGKTTVGKLLPRIFSALGVFMHSAEDTLVVSSGELIAPFEGQTAPKTQRLFYTNLGRPVLLDEAYTLVSQGKGSGFGGEALGVLVGLLSDYEGMGMWLFAGYEDWIENTIIKANPGLSRRVRDRFYFENYSAVELTEIYARLAAANRGKFTYAEGALQQVREVIDAVWRAGLFRNLNAGGVKSLFREINAQATLIVTGVADAGDLANYRPPDRPVEVGEKAIQRGSTVWLAAQNDTYAFRDDALEDVDEDTLLTPERVPDGSKFSTAMPPDGSSRDVAGPVIGTPYEARTLSSTYAKAMQTFFDGERKASANYQGSRINQEVYAKVRDLWQHTQRNDAWQLDIWWLDTFATKLRDAFRSIDGEVDRLKDETTACRLRRLRGGPSDDCFANNAMINLYVDLGEALVGCGGVGSGLVESMIERYRQNPQGLTQALMATKGGNSYSVNAEMNRVRRRLQEYVNAAREMCTRLRSLRVPAMGEELLCGSCYRPEVSICSGCNVATVCGACLHSHWTDLHQWDECAALATGDTDHILDYYRDMHELDSVDEDCIFANDLDCPIGVYAYVQARHAPFTRDDLVDDVDLAELIFQVVEAEEAEEERWGDAAKISPLTSKLLSIADRALDGQLQKGDLHAALEIINAKSSYGRSRRRTRRARKKRRRRDKRERKRRIRKEKKRKRDAKRRERKAKKQERKAKKKAKKERKEERRLKRDAKRERRADRREAASAKRDARKERSTSRGADRAERRAEKAESRRDKAQSKADELTQRRRDRAEQFAEEFAEE